MHSKVYRKHAVTLDKSHYEILIGRNIIACVGKFLAEKVNDKRVMIVIDEFFSQEVLDSLLRDLSGVGFAVYVYNFKAGKQHKNLNETINIYEILESNGFARDSTLVAIGGGVIGDLAGFAASTYLRGMNFIHVPTTLTAMIDSSIGGKVAINFKRTVNAIGNYYHPILNVIDLQFIDSLSDRDFRAGLAEIIKSAIICDKKLFATLNSNEVSILNREESILLEIIYRAIEIKLDHVRNDVREQNLRLKLNYGHTLGHSVETSTGIYEEVYRHGEGVSLGMVGAANIAKNFLNCESSVLHEHEEILQKYGLPTKIESGKIGFERTALLNECLKNVWKDKKRMDNKLRFILPLSIGRCEVYTDIPDELIKEAFDCLIRE